MSVTRRYCRLTILDSYNPSGGAYDNFYASITEINLLDNTDTPISRTGWTISVDSEETNFAELKENAVDGNTVTKWSSQWDGGGPSHPHTFTIDQGSAIQFYKLRVKNRVDAASTSAPGGYQVHSSPDGSSWTLCGSGTFQTGTPSNGADLTTAELFEVAGAAASIAVLLQNYRNMGLIQ